MPHLGSGVGYGPFGAVGDERVESSGFRREAEKDGSLDTATVLSSGASLKSRRLGGRSGTESVNLPVPHGPLRQVFQHRSGCGDAECLAGCKILYQMWELL